jgi:hypothetical protein
MRLAGTAAARRTRSRGDVTLEARNLINGGRARPGATLEDDRLVELLVDRPDHRRIVGDTTQVGLSCTAGHPGRLRRHRLKNRIPHASDLLEPDEDETEERTGTRRMLTIRPGRRGGGIRPIRPPTHPTHPTRNKGERETKAIACASLPARVPNIEAAQEGADPSVQSPRNRSVPRDASYRADLARGPVPCLRPMPPGAWASAKIESRDSAESSGRWSPGFSPRTRAA